MSERLDASRGVLHQVLIERPVRWEGERYWSGYTPNYLRVLLPVGDLDPNEAPSPWNQLLSVRTTRLREDPQAHDLAAEALEIPQV
jgi:hypothetical protein